MAFDFSTLVTDRKQSDVAYVKQLIAKIVAGTETEAELAEWKSFTLKGSYNYTDLNRVTAAMEDLKLRLEGYGYAVQGYQKIKVPHPVSSTSRLPDGYMELSWIESTGTQYIDSGIVVSTASVKRLRVVADFNFVTVSGTNFLGISDSNAVFWFGTFGGNIWYGDGVNSATTNVAYDGIRHVFDLNAKKGTFTVSGTPVDISGISINNPAGSGKFLLPAGGSGFVLYSCQMYDNDIIVRDFVPCINPDGEVGLYDLVTAAFFGNAGTGAFIAGDMVSLPSGVVSMTNLVADGSFETTGTWVTWSADALVTEQSLFGSKSLKLTGDQLANISVATPIVGHKYYGREYIKTDGEVTIGDGRFEVHGGDGVGLNWVYGWNRGNYPNWTMQSAIHEIEVVNASSYVLRTFKVGGTGTAYVDGILLVDLTASFGAGFEPDKEWCDAHIPFFEGTQSVKLPPRYEWKEYDAPTTGQMAVYLRNIFIIRSVLAVMASTPKVPDDMIGLMVKEANDIEVILMDVYRQINIMTTTFIPCGEALSGGDNL